LLTGDFCGDWEVVARTGDWGLGGKPGRGRGRFVIIVFPTSVTVDLTRMDKNHLSAKIAVSQVEYGFYYGENLPII
jgi:hypothetical protein